MSCFEKNRDGLVAFLNAVSSLTSMKSPTDTSVVDPPLHEANSFACVPPERQPRLRIEKYDTVTVQSINASLRQMMVCQHPECRNIGRLFDAAVNAESEWPLVHGHCRYIGFNGREVDGVFLLSNRRLQVFSMESGAKIVVVELIKRLLGKLPVPLLDKVAGFLLFSLPRAACVALRGGKDQLIANALAVEPTQLMAERPALRKVQDYRVADFKEHVAQVDIGVGVWTGVLARKFGVSFSPTALSKSFRVPADLILPEHAMLEPVERLLAAIRPTLRQVGLDYQWDADRQKLSIRSTPPASEEAA